ncbi:hypothetical protein B0T20DRAFT_200678 [Sordaria brevicollis]|uniref:Uncharacterized protein n=1 Tax=Sordaria brevicollis TaxID=83679 RepID=A0AAE0UBL8_SORBR|nr:hypothetical protein B0T20DRAFT_200678 [Sordaria brevicollis]
MGFFAPSHHERLDCGLLLLWGSHAQYGVMSRCQALIPQAKPGRPRTFQPRRPNFLVHPPGTLPPKHQPAPAPATSLPPHNGYIYQNFSPFFHQPPMGPRVVKRFGSRHDLRPVLCSIPGRGTKLRVKPTDDYRLSTIGYRQPTIPRPPKERNSSRSLTTPGDLTVPFNFFAISFGSGFY